ncbi:MAG: HAD family hydrolase [Anaerolineaceae bacterium]
MTYRMLALDLDGTLMNGQGRVGARDAAALTSLAGRGVLIAPATARWYQAAVRPFERLGLHTAAIASAGADVRLQGGEVVAATPLPPVFAHFIGDLCDRAGWTATLTVPERAYSRADHLPPWAANAPEWLAPVTHLRDAELTALLSVLIEAPAEDAFLAELTTWRDRLTFSSALSFAGALLLTMTAKEVDKGSALRALCAATGIDPADVVAIGDSAVDVPMFEVAGCAVAMGNATPDARTAAGMVVASVEDGGVAEAIERLF